ncbi:MAG: hypothetical protein CM1200mP41_07140 [Gammaproteobacteria bacterium]|nr:MAG: hypothetical protein CM1200mP41_07140 [Gammaproteobacteria bacterium]
MAPRRPQRIASPLQIMIDGPLGGAAFNNEFGRPNIGGYFRTFEVTDADGSNARRRGYHKPIMLAGGPSAIFVKGTFTRKRFQAGHRSSC